jgi:hypothetical protein
MDNEKQKIMYESYFLNKGVIQFILEMDKANLEIQLEKAKKYCDISAKDADDLQNQLQNTNFLSVKRVSSWEFSSIPVLNYTGKVRNFDYCRANFSLVNSWGFKRPYRYFQIIYSSDFLVTWMGYVLTGGPIFWVSIENTVYRIIYLHKELRLYPNICTEPELVTGLNPIALDNVVKKYHKCLRVFDPSFKMLEHETGFKTIELDQYFQKGFFIKGQNIIIMNIKK